MKMGPPCSSRSSREISERHGSERVEGAPKSIEALTKPRPRVIGYNGWGVAKGVCSGLQAFCKERERKGVTRGGEKVKKAKVGGE